MSIASNQSLLRTSSPALSTRARRRTSWPYADFVVHEAHGVVEVWPGRNVAVVLLPLLVPRLNVADLVVGQHLRDHPSMFGLSAERPDSCGNEAAVALDGRLCGAARRNRGGLAAVLMQ